MATVPYMVSIGNHERDWPESGDWFPVDMHDSGGECGVAHERRFLMPSRDQDTPWCDTCGHSALPSAAAAPLSCPRADLAVRQGGMHRHPGTRPPLPALPRRRHRAVERRCPCMSV